MNILLACAGGFSTSLLVERMKKSAADQNKNYHIKAIAFNNLKQNLNDIDVVLLGPQIKNSLAVAKEIIGDKKIPVALIKMKDYGRVDGNAVLKFAEELYEDNKK